jgi:hypothetical protein
MLVSRTVWYPGMVMGGWGPGSTLLLLGSKTLVTRVISLAFPLHFCSWPDFYKEATPHIAQWFSVDTRCNMCVSDCVLAELPMSWYTVLWFLFTFFSGWFCFFFGLFLFWHRLYSPGCPGTLILLITLVGEIIVWATMPDIPFHHFWFSPVLYSA